jgi:hypothetical protein
MPSLLERKLAKMFSHNLDATNDDVITLFNLDGGPPPKLVQGRFVLPQDQAERTEESGIVDTSTQLPETS